MANRAAERLIMSKRPTSDTTISPLSQEHKSDRLHKADLAPDPFRQFKQWFERAWAANQINPHAMTLATATAEGLPSARIVLLRDYDEHGLTFYSDYRSQKGQELLENPHAALVFYWPTLEQQIRVTGQVSRMSPEESDNYFHSRPVPTRLAALSSHQSEVVSSRAVLEDRFQELEARYKEQEIPRPSAWGGFRLKPMMFEFWQNQSDRLHDRLRYTRQPDERWSIERLSP